MEGDAEDQLTDPPDGLSAQELAQFYKSQAQQLAKILSGRRSVPVKDVSSPKAQTKPQDVRIDLADHSTRLVMTASRY